jgi:hypothetical protein
MHTAALAERQVHEPGKSVCIGVLENVCCPLRKLYVRNNERIGIQYLDSGILLFAACRCNEEQGFVLHELPGTCLYDKGVGWRVTGGTFIYLIRAVFLEDEVIVLRPLVNPICNIVSPG